MICPHCGRALRASENLALLEGEAWWHVILQAAGWVALFAALVLFFHYA